jgi:hypothetical protein
MYMRTLFRLKSSFATMYKTPIWYMKLWKNWLNVNKFVILNSNFVRKRTRASRLRCGMNGGGSCHRITMDFMFSFTKLW